MSAASVSPARPARSRLALPRSVRALWLELKRNSVPYVLPLLAAVFYFDTVRTAGGYPPVWTVRSSAIGNHMLFEFSVFAGGLAAWAGSREGRRNTLDLVATTPRAAWARLSASLAGTLCWLLLAFLAGVAVLYIQTALQATWGGPPLWPVLVGVAGVIAVTAGGFAAGVFFPGRFTAPLVAIGAAVLYMTGFREALGMTASSGTYALLSPSSSVPLADAGVYYHVAPDLPITQVMFMGGIAVVLFGVLGLALGLRELASASGLRSLRAARTRKDGWLLRAAVVVLIACGVAASSTAFALAGTAQPDPAAGTSQNGTVLGWEIPALHSTAGDQPLPVLQDCTSGSGSQVTPGAGSQAVSGAGFQVCVHPAFQFDLDAVAAALDPVAAEIAGLPGAPVRAEEVASVSGGHEVFSGISGNPPVFEFTAEHVGTLFGEFNGIHDPAVWNQGFRQGLLDAFLAGPSRHAGPGPAAPLGPAQQAVEDALLTAAGTQPDQPNGQPAAGASAAVSAAAQRFGALSASARHAWLATHLTALRAGAITLAQLP